MNKLEREKLREIATCTLGCNIPYSSTVKMWENTLALLNYIDLLEQQLTPEQLEFLRRSHE
jgi:hypothetical protein